MPELKWSRKDLYGQGISKVDITQPDHNVDKAMLNILDCVLVQCSIGSTTGCTITEKAPTRSLNVKLGPQCNYHMGRDGTFVSRTQFQVERPWGQRP